jgi:hypothetical protein
MRYQHALLLAGSAAAFGLLFPWRQPGAGKPVTAEDTGYYCEVEGRDLSTKAYPPGDGILMRLDEAVRACDFARQTITFERGGDIVCHHVGDERTPRARTPSDAEAYGAPGGIKPIRP